MIRLHRLYVNCISLLLDIVFKLRLFIQHVLGIINNCIDILLVILSLFIPTKLA